jgi:Zn-dependent protease
VVLLEPEPTQFDLRWRMFGIGVRIHPMFWLVACLMGANLLQEPKGVALLLIWVACFFVSVFVHELGHVFMGRAFGAHSNIVLYAFGGLAIGSANLGSRWKRIAVSFAGPLAGFLLLGVAVLTSFAVFDTAPRYLGEAIEQVRPALPVEASSVTFRDWLAIAVAMLYLMNLFWSLLNLVPVWPLDGGQISRDFLTWKAPRNGVRISLAISFGLAAFLAIHALVAERGIVLIPFLALGWMAAMLFAMLAVESFLLLQQMSTPRRPTYLDDDDPWRR